MKYTDIVLPMDVKAIRKILPHRYPFLLIDRINEIDFEKGYIIGQKNVTINEEFFQGHFPDAPIMPGVLILEALAQAGAVYTSLKKYQDKLAVLLNMDNVKFRHAVRPGDVLILRAEEGFLNSRGGRFKAIATVGDKLAAEGEIGFALVERDQL
jgi:3-hydroxyacyl-[acyl-carrier-protein] dehydratase